jgi:dienelactone hydrolase
MLASSLPVLIPIQIFLACPFLITRSEERHIPPESSFLSYLSQLLADGFAENGFQVCCVHTCLRGDLANTILDVYARHFRQRPSPGELSSRRKHTTSEYPQTTNSILCGVQWSLQAWFAKHPDDKTWPPLRAVLKALKEQGITTFGATGYCFGAKNVVELAIEGEIAAGAIAHPARLELPTDLERLAASGSKAKILINSCEFDSSFASEAQAKADELLGDGKYQAGYKRAHWEGCSHGFAVRGNMSNPKIKAGKEGAFKATVELFQSALA